MLAGHYGPGSSGLLYSLRHVQNAPKSARWQMRLEFPAFTVLAMDKHTPFDELAVALTRKRALKLIGASVLAAFLPGVAGARKRNTCPPGTVRVCKPRKGRRPGKVCTCKPHFRLG